MAARTFGNIDPSCLTSEQLEALAAVGIGNNDLIDNGCDAASLNTCGRDANELVTLYPLYNEGQGVYTAWGEIALPWNHEDLVSNEQWSTSNYVDEYSYRVGDIVYRFEKDGYKIVVYEAIQNVPVPAGLFNPALWTEVCSVTTSELVGLPDVRNFQQYDSSATYSISDVVVKNSGCNNYTCAYISLTGQNTAPPSQDWERLYCIPNGNPSTCVKQVSCSDPNRQLISLSNGESDLICVPVESTTGVRPRR